MIYTVSGTLSWNWYNYLTFPPNIQNLPTTTEAHLSARYGFKRWWSKKLDFGQIIITTPWTSAFKGHLQTWVWGGFMKASWALFFFKISYTISQNFTEISVECAIHFLVLFWDIDTVRSTTVFGNLTNTKINLCCQKYQVQNYSSVKENIIFHNFGQDMFFRNDIWETIFCSLLKGETFLSATF